MTRTFEVVVIGSGFGGAVVACRAAQRWPGEVLVLERGKRYARGSFARTPSEMRDNFWNADGQRRDHDYRHPEQSGLFDVRSFRRMDVILAAGLGGGSLIYANVLLEPPDAVFADPRWPSTCSRDALRAYYDTARTVLGGRKLPPATDAFRTVTRTHVFEEAAVAMGRRSTPLDIAVFFGNDPDVPLAPGQSERNAFGAEQSSCVYCGECDLGCNVSAKNTLDLNYLFAAEHHHGAVIETLRLVESIVPLGPEGNDDPTADGSNGYRVHYAALPGVNASSPVTKHSVVAKRVVLGAGAFGSTELLLRCRDVHATLPRLSPRLGAGVSGNGDFLSFVFGGRDRTALDHGPVITQGIDFNLFADHDPERAFIMEDAGFPNAAAWYLEGMKPRLLQLRVMAKAARHTIARMPHRRTRGRVGYKLRDAMGGSVTGHAAGLLCMGLDKATGRLSLDRHGWVRLQWPQGENRPLYRAIVAASKSFGRAVDATMVVQAPNWWLPLRRNVTVHALGGCLLGDSPEKGVVQAGADRFGEVFGYSGLYVADGAIVPVALGANPSLTIAALAEKIAAGLTGREPDVQLGSPR